MKESENVSLQSGIAFYENISCLGNGFSKVVELARFTMSIHEIRFPQQLFAEIESLAFYREYFSRGVRIDYNPDRQAFYLNLFVVNFHLSGIGLLFFYDLCGHQRYVLLYKPYH